MMRTVDLPEGAFILRDRHEAMERYHSVSDPRDVWEVYTENSLVSVDPKPIWVETGPATRTLQARAKSEKLAAHTVEIRTGQRVASVSYDP